MGLTGIVTRATVRLVPIETDRMAIDTDRFDDLDALMAAMVASDDGYRYSVAWVDCMTTGRASVAASSPAGTTHGATTCRSPRRRPALRAHGLAPARAAARAGRAAQPALGAGVQRGVVPQGATAPPRPSGRALHVLPSSRLGDGLEPALRPQGRGAVPVRVPDASSDTVRLAIELLGSSGVPSFLGVLKRFGPADPGPLSFPVQGWTLALDVPVGPPRLPRVLDALDELVVAAGGRVYLAKDARLDPSRLAQMYPRLDELVAVRARLDPDGVLGSDLARRLGIR